VDVEGAATPEQIPERILDKHIAAFFRAVRELGLPQTEVRARVAQWLTAPVPDHFVVIEPDAEVRRILLAEIGELSKFRAVGASIEDCKKRETLAGAIPLCRPSQAKAVRAVLPAGVELITLPIRSANAWLNPWLPAPEGLLVGVVSHWKEFLTTARTMLIAAGLPAEVLVFRDAREAGWKRGLEQAAAILCDAHTATVAGFPKRPQKIVFRLLAESARAELGAYARQDGL
jgi:GntR family transcriptional regulator